VFWQGLVQEQNATGVELAQKLGGYSLPIFWEPAAKMYLAHIKYQRTLQGRR